MSEFNEPWSVRHLGGVRYELVDRSGKALDQDAIRRIVDCVNALEGIRNPAAVKDVIEAAKTYHATLWTALQRLEDGASNDDVLTSAQEIRLAYEGIGMSLAALDGEAG